MGSPFGNVSDAHDGSPSTQQVTLTGYWIYKNPVTVAQYRAFCSATGHALPLYPTSIFTWSNYSDWTGAGIQQTPIINVSWNDCAAYAAWAGVSLPTEAQYEYAVRGPQGNNYPWGGTATAADPYNGWDQSKCGNAWSSYDAGISTWPTGSFPAGASWCGAQNMAGNVWEWCKDWVGDYSSTPVTNPTGPTTGSLRVYRGGAWNSRFENDFRGAYRIYGYPDYGYYYIGFRCAALKPGP